MRSVVIRMDIDEMPTACGPCELSCTAICKEWTKVDRKEIWRTKSPNCPIIAILPEGHGDLVEAKEITVNVTIKGKKCSADVYATTIVPATNTPTNTPTATERSEA